MYSVWGLPEPLCGSQQMDLARPSKFHPITTGGCDETWYTGSAGWLYRLITESLLGLRLEGTKLQIEPCLSEEWTQYTLSYRYQHTVYQIHISQT